MRFLKINDKWFMIFNIMGLQNVIKCCILSIGSVRLAERYALRVVGDTHREYRLLKISRPPGRPLKLGYSGAGLYYFYEDLCHRGANLQSKNYSAA